MDLAHLTENAETQLELILAQTIGSVLGDKKIEFGELTIECPSNELLNLIETLKRNRLFEYTTLIDITAVDRPDQEERFLVVYHLLSMTQNQRIRIHVPTIEGAPVPSLCDIHPSANWFEREVFDMFGIGFSDHPDMRRILTDYGFEGHPLRKDFPMSGYTQMRYDDVEKKCVYEPVDLVQDFRSFDFLSPWEGAKYILPGDEKSENS